MKNNNYHDLVDRNAIADSVEYWNNRGNDGYQHEFVGKTVDDAIAYWKAQAKKTDAIETVLEVYEENHDLIGNDDDFAIVASLLNHPERDRLRLIHDGSYYTHRIWFHVNSNGYVNVSPSICWKDSEFKRMSKHLNEMSPSEKIDFLFNNFEVVYIQTPEISDRNDIKRWIREKQFYLDTDTGWFDFD